MSFRGDGIDDETPLFWSPEYIFELPEPCLPLRVYFFFASHGWISYIIHCDL